MFHSLIFTMASNIAPDEDEPMHPAGLDMTRGSLQDILDGEDVNVSTALPTVPLDATDPFINPNQTLADIIPDRNLGPLSSLKITDADLIICNLNNELSATVEKNSPIRGWGGLSKMSNKMSKMSIIELSQLGQDLFDF